MNIEKQASALAGGAPNPEQLRKVNLQSKSPLRAEDIYVFSLRLCDDQVDRDGERFATEALPELGRLFVGKPGVVDHNWSAEKQTARIFDTEVVQEDGVSWLKAWAYMPRKGREALIADIESGIRREVSISCSMGRRICSICGGEIGTCGHRSGACYEGNVCVAVLTEPRDAYEFSFVAVPAQPKAGVVKHWKGGEEMDLTEYVEKSGSGALEQELRRLQKQAEYGKLRRAQAEQETVRMGVALELGLSREELKQLVQGMESSTLDSFQAALQKKMALQFPAKSQLGTDSPERDMGDAYLI